MAKPNPERCAATRRKIMDSFWELYAKGGYKAATVSAIIKNASIHRSTFYEYFSDAQAVLEAIEDEQISNVEGYVSHAAGNIENVDPVAILMGVYGENAEYLSVLLGDSANSSFSSKLKSRIIPIVQDKLRIDADEGTNRYLFEFFLSGMLAAISLWYKRDCKESPDALAKTMRTMMLEGPFAFIKR